MKRNLFKNYIFYILYQVFTILIPFIVVPYTTRTIGAEGLGINAFSSSIVQWFVIFGYMGISMYGNKEIARVRDDKAHLSKTFMGILSMQVCNMLLVIILYFLFVVFAPLEYKNIYLIQGVSLFATVFDITWFFLGVEDFKKSSLRSIIFRLINVALIFMFVKSIDDLDIFVWINVVTAVLAQLVLFFQLKEYINFKPVNIIESYKIHMKPNLVLFVPQIAISIYSVLDQTMTGLLADKTQLAFYQQAIRFDKMFLYFITSIGMVMLPRIANEHAKGDDNKINDYLNVTFKLALYLAIPMMFGMIGVGPFFIDWFMAPEFKIVGFLIAMMSPIILFIALSNVFGTQYLVPTNRLSQYSKSVIIGAIANFLFNLLLIPRFGAIGAGLSVMFAELCVTAVQYFYIRKSIQLNVGLKSIIIYFISAILMCAVVYGIGLSFGPRILTNLLQVTAGFIVYMALLTLMKEPFHIKMLDQVLRLVKLKKELEGTMAKVSIIVPTYNVEQYIRKCLDSLVNQTSKDFIAYIINDGSPANEFEIANEYAEKYDFIKSIKKENGGYGSVLNMAFAMIDTPYALICDPDDYLVENTIEHLLYLMESNEADMVVGSKNLIYSDNSEVVYDQTYNKSIVKLIDKQCYKRSDDNFKDLYFVDPSPHSKLYKTEFAKKVKFPLKVSFTDNLLFFVCLNQANKVVYSNEPLAYYLINREGNTSTDVKPQVIDYWIKVQTEILEQSKQLDNVPSVFYYRMFETFKFVFNMIEKVHADKKVLLEKLKSTYTIFEPLLPHYSVIEEYYTKMSDVSGKERINDLALINSKDRAVFDKLVYRKLNRLLYGNGLKTKILNLIGGI